MNLTTIALIPEKPNATHIADLCNVQYMILSKTLVERIRPLPSKFISPNQGAFMPGKRANDNVVIAKEGVPMMS